MNIKNLILLILMVCIYFNLFTQNQNKSFISGYVFGYDPDTIYWNNVFVERSDTGLVFSEKFHSYYEVKMYQSSTYCNNDGMPLLVWQGCFLLDANTMTPIYNGDFSQTIGANKHPTNYCQLKNINPNQQYHNGYGIPFTAFFLDREKDEDILIVYNRLINKSTRLDSFNLYFAKVDLNGSPEGKPAVVERDSMPFTDINLNISSLHTIRHANGVDWYIVFLESRTMNYYSILYDDSGLHEPVVSRFEHLANPVDEDGYSAVSPSGDQFAYVSGQVNRFFVADFDRCSGLFSNIRQDSFAILDKAKIGPFRFCEFSPSGRFIYFSTLLHIYQYDLEEDDFSSSGLLVGTFDETKQPTPLPNIYGYFSNMIRGKDGRMYMWTVNGVPLLSKMNYPDRKDDVGLVQDYIKLPYYPPWWAPRLIDFEMGPVPGAPCISANKAADAIGDLSVYPNPATEVIKLEGSFIDAYVAFDICDVQGKKVLTGTFNGTDIDISSLQSGVYFVNLKTPSHTKSATVKFVKIR